MESETGVWLDRIETRRADNSLYGNVKEVAKATFVCVIALYENIISDLKNTFDVFNQVATQTHTIADNAREVDRSKLKMKTYRRR